MLLVFLLALRIDQDIVDEHNNELIQVRLAHSVHVIHEDRWCIRQSEWHNQKLVMAVTSSECCFGDVLISDSHLMVSRSQINLRVIGRPLQLVEQVVNTWERITILHGHLVKFAVVNTHSEGTVFLLHE
ncbi:hypothetical protein Hanom_Chr15g01410471 [Helianthus anomalus]